MKQIKFICDKCHSENIESKTVRYDEVEEKRSTHNLDWEYWETISYKIKYTCSCNNCGHRFTEYP